MYNTACNTFFNQKICNVILALLLADCIAINKLLNPSGF